MKSKCQVDLIDMQSEKDREFRCVINYQNHLTKFILRRALRTKIDEEVA